MKKVCAALLSAALLTGITASADSYNNSAFIGKWGSPKNTEGNSSQLYINYCDKDNIQVDFKQIENGKEPFDFTEYAGKVTAQEDGSLRAHLLFDCIDEYGTSKPGYMDIAMFVDNIWLSVYLFDGTTFFNNTMKYASSERFNPYAPPFSYNVSIELNGAKQETASKPFIVNGTTYIPLRGVLDAMNLNVYWDDYSDDNAHTQLITTARNDTILQFKRCDDGRGFSPWTLTMWKNDQADTSAEPAESFDISLHQPIIIDGSSYIPLRTVSECYKAEVDWTDETKTVSLKDNIASDTKKTDNEIQRIQAFGKADADKYAAYYEGMTINDPTPYYTYKSKYYYYMQDNVRYKVHFDSKIE